MKHMYILLFCTIAYCKAIREDYFLDNDELNLKDQNENISLSKSMANLQMLKNKLSNSTSFSADNMTTYSNQSNLKQYEDFDIDDSVTNNELAVGKRLIGAEYSYNNDDAYGILRGITSNVSKGNTLLNVFRDYVYLYDEPSTSGLPALRIQEYDSQIDQKVNESDYSENTTEETSEKLLIDFYNLQPAGSKLVLEGKPEPSGFQKYTNNNIWYVPENLPCWDLPILYGELGQSKQKSVFLTYSAKLKNVIEKIEDEKIASKKLNIPVSQTINKWCAADPCYGDHTLCLFPDPINSKLCINDYEVSTPTMVARIGLVNTVNSMRNRVATGVAELYKHLPTAADMNQIIYDFDLQSMAEAWLHQCLPGPSACSSLDGNYVAQLECTKYTEYCCIQSYQNEIGSKCIPQHECFIDPIVGCIHTWFRSAESELTATDVECGHITPHTFNTVQLLWAETNKIGCAYGRRPWGDVRVVCNFAPGAPFSIYTKSFCGFIHHKEMIEAFSGNITSSEFLLNLGITLHAVTAFDSTEVAFASHDFNYSLRFSDIDILSKIYARRWIRHELDQYDNGTMGLIARLVTKYTFGEDSGPQCDTSRHIYESGEPGSMCVEKGRRFHALCYDFRDPTPGYRLVAVLAPVALFSLILYDLFSGVVRQTNY